jgi:hypothetical protein
MITGLFIDNGPVKPVNRTEDHFVSRYAVVVCKSGNATPSVTAHGAQSAIGIVVQHLKISSITFSDKHQPVSADAKMPVAHFSDSFNAVVKPAMAVINDDKVISVSLVFIKFYGHRTNIEQLLIFVKEKNIGRIFAEPRYKILTRGRFLCLTNLNAG